MIRFVAHRRWRTRTSPAIRRRHRAAWLGIAIASVVVSPLITDSPDATSLGDSEVATASGHLPRHSVAADRHIHVTAPPPKGYGSETDGRARLVSVVIPTHDRAPLLRDAIESALASPLIADPRQIVVVDDDSHDRTCEVAQQLGVTYLRTACHSAAGSRNAGLSVAQTPYVTFLDDDDVWLPGNMEPQLAALEGAPRAALAYGLAQPVNQDLEPIFQRFPASLHSGHVPEKLHLAYPQLGVTLFRRGALVDVGGFDLSIRYHEDADLMLRVAARHDLVGVDVVGMLYRERPASRARADYFWGEARREVTRWKPRRLGIGWTTSARFRFKTRGLFSGRFCDDAVASLEAGHRQDALVCLGRAFWISPPHALRHARWLGSILWRCVIGRGWSQTWTGRHGGAMSSG